VRSLANDPGAIGYLPLGAISLLKPIRLQTATGHYVQSDDYGVATKDFPLELTLLLYRSLRESNKEAEDFLRHARSTPAQVAAMFVGLSQITPQLLFAKLPESAPDDYRKAVANGLRVSITIRFAPGSTDLDPGSARDLDALARYLRLLHVPREKLQHIAFSEDTGDPGENAKIAMHLGATVARELRHRHVRTGQVIEFGARMPLANDSIPAGRNRNRRVETWILP
jgi:phosphate transport system substrate-binding protein